MSATQEIKPANRRSWRRALRGPALFTLTLFAVEFLDELIYGVHGAALPLIRDDLALSYVQVGLLLAIPGYVGLVLDPAIGLLGDAWHRKALVVGGALVTALAAALTAGAQSFALLVAAFTLSYPASTAYVSLSQATLMDRNPGRHEHVMARWAVLGSLGNLAGPLLVGAALALGLGWRSVFLLMAGLSGAAALIFWRRRFDGGRQAGEVPGLRAVIRDLPRALRDSGILRWMLLMQLADLLLDVFYSFCALYFTDVAGAGAGGASLAVAVLTGTGLLGDLLLIPLLERIDGVRLVRATAFLALLVYPAFLLVPALWAKLALLAVLGPLRSGWWQVLDGRAYSALPGRSGTVVALSSLTGLLGAAYPLILGAVAENWGLPAAMWVLLGAPIALVLWLP